MAWLSLATTGMRWAEFVALHARGVVLAIGFGVAAWGTAAALRAAESPSWLVAVASSLAPMLAFVACVRAAPRRVLGDDGVWLWRTVVAAR